MLAGAMIATIVACGGGGGGGGGTTTGPTITTHPLTHSVAEGNATSFTVAASGAGLTYQWYKDGAVLPSATGSTYSIGSAATANIGSYYAIVSNIDGSTASNVATLSVTGTGGVDTTIK